MSYVCQREREREMEWERELSLLQFVKRSPCIIILSLDLSVCACVRTSGRSPEASWPWHKKLFLCKTKVWHYCLWPTGNRSSSRLNQVFQKRVGQNGDRQRYTPVAAQRRRQSNVWDLRLSIWEVGDSVLGTCCPEFFRAKLLDEQRLADWTSHMAMHMCINVWN